MLDSIGTFLQACALVYERSRLFFAFLFSFMRAASAARIKLNRKTKKFSRHTCNLRPMETSLNSESVRQTENANSPLFLLNPDLQDCR